MFKDREDAGRQLAKALAKYKSQDTIILAIPRGGVPVGFEVAKALGGSLDVLVGALWNPEYGLGAIASGVQILDIDSMNALDLRPDDLRNVIAEEQIELNRRTLLYRGSRDFLELANKTVILIDDGLATGITARAAIKVIRKLRPAQLILATPVGAPDTVDSLRRLVDKVICLETPQFFLAVGQHYQEFPQVSDDEVVALLDEAQATR
jgi:putative phosphoribosyl transferase